MRLKIEDIPEGSSQYTGSVPIDLPEPDGYVSAGAGISCTADVERTAENLYLHVVFGGSVRVRCARCLKEFELAVQGETRLLRGTGGMAGEDDDAETYFEDDGFVNVGAAVHDEVITELPLMPLCSASCKGGEYITQRSDSAAAPRGPAIDPRWAPLQKLGKRK